MNAIEYLRSKGILEIDEGCANDADNSTWVNQRMVIGWMEEYHQSKLKNLGDIGNVRDCSCGECVPVWTYMEIQECENCKELLK